MSYNPVMLDIICHFWMSFSCFYLTYFLIRQATFWKDDLDWTKLQSDQSVYANLLAAQPNPNPIEKLVDNVGYEAPVGLLTSPVLSFPHHY